MWIVLVPEFAEKNMDLFSRFIPNLVGHACSLDEEINETKALQENLRNQEEFLRYKQSVTISISTVYSTRTITMYILSNGTLFFQGRKCA